MTEEYIVGSTVPLNAIYYDTNNELVDPDADPTIEVKDAKNRSVQTGLKATKLSKGTYQCNFTTTGLTKGTYFFIYTALFNGFPDKTSGSFELKDV